jgi:hypothetical protein
MSGCIEPDETDSTEPTVIASVYTDHQKWIHYTDGSAKLIGSTKTVTPGYKTGMKVKPNMPVKNYSNDYNDLCAVYWLQYKNFFSSPFPVEHRFLCRQYSKQRAAIADLTKQVDALRAELEEVRMDRVLVQVSDGWIAEAVLGSALILLLAIIAVITRTSRRP